MTRPRHPRAVRTSLPGEQWMPLVGFEHAYDVSSLGRVFSHPRPKTPGGVLVHKHDRNGYPQVALVRDGRTYKLRVHLLVMRTFVGPAPAGLQVRHLDGSRDPRLSNLAYDTPSENMRDLVRHGVSPARNRTHCAQGHPFDEGNTYWWRGKRHCRACRHETYLERRRSA